MPLCALKGRHKPDSLYPRQASMASRTLSSRTCLFYVLIARPGVPAGHTGTVGGDARECNIKLNLKLSGYLSSRQDLCWPFRPQAVAVQSSTGRCPALIYTGPLGRARNCHIHAEPDLALRERTVGLNGYSLSPPLTPHPSLLTPSLLPSPLLTPHSSLLPLEKD